MNPAYPGGFEILAASRPHAVVLQHAPARREYDGFPGYKLHDLETQIQAIELVSDTPVAAIAVNHEDLSPARVADVCREIEKTTGLPAVDPLTEGPRRIAETLVKRTAKRTGC